MTDETVTASAPNSQPETTSYVWGLDLSLTLQGSDGVGGALAMIRYDSNYTENFFYYADANGNIGQMMLDDGLLSMRCEYDAYGNFLLQSDLQNCNALKSMSKYFDNDVCAYFFGCRVYFNKLGKWFSKDPIEELGFNMIMEEYINISINTSLNYYLFCNNDAVNHFDLYGLVANWHHLLPSEFSEKFLAAGIEDINAAKYGIILEAEIHTGKTGLHSAGWNQEWKIFFDKIKPPPQNLWVTGIGNASIKE